MLTLYVKNNCQYCDKVHEVGRELGITFDEKNTVDPTIVEEVVSRGGKRQVPFLVDEENNTKLYGSDEIIKYLHQRFK